MRTENSTESHDKPLVPNINDTLCKECWPHSISISIYFVQNQVGLHSQKTNEQDNQAHNMLSQLPAVKDRKVKQQYKWKNEKNYI